MLIPYIMGEESVGGNEGGRSGMCNVEIYGYKQAETSIWATLLSTYQRKAMK